MIPQLKNDEKNQARVDKGTLFEGLDLPQIGNELIIVKSPICVRVKHCGSFAEIGPCDPDGEACNHSVRCQRCGVTGTESWNLKIGADAHRRAMCLSALDWEEEDRRRAERPVRKTGRSKKETTVAADEP